jgi:glucokinase
MVMFTLGTGVGGGLIIDGRLVRGFFDNAAELGHIIVDPGGLPCGCGQLGCLEAYTSAMHVAKRARSALDAGQDSSLKKLADQGTQIECEHVAQAAADGDPLATTIWDDACKYLALACVMMQHTTNPQRVVMAGGMIAAGDFLLSGIRRHFDRLTWQIVDDQPDIMLATLGNDAGLIGAAGCAKVAKETGELIE